MNILQKTLPHLDLAAKAEFLGRIISRFDPDYDALLKQYGVPLDVSEQWRQDYRDVMAERCETYKLTKIPKNILAVITARKGSTGLPRKALRDLNGKPVIAHTIAACLESKYIGRIVVTTDDPEIRNVALAAGAEAPFLRPEYLGGNYIGLDHVIIHATTWLEIFDDYWFDLILNPSPTYPVRHAGDIDAAIERLVAEEDASCLTAVSELEHYRGRAIFERPEGSDNNVLTFHTAFPDEPIYSQSGYIGITHRWRKSSLPLPFFVERERNVDIDFEKDLSICRMVSCPDMCRGLLNDFFESRKADVPATGASYPDFAFVIHVDFTFDSLETEKRKMIHEWVNAAKSMGLENIFLAGGGEALESLAEDFGCRAYVTNEGLDGNGFPTSGYVRGVLDACGKSLEHFCVIRGNGFLANRAYLSGFLDQYFRGSQPLVSVSHPKISPKWTKVVRDNQVHRTFDGKVYDQRQLLPDLYVQDLVAVIAETQSLKSDGVESFSGCIWSHEPAIVVNSRMDIIEALASSR